MMRAQEPPEEPPMVAAGVGVEPERATLHAGLDEGEDFFFDEFGVEAAHGVVFEAAAQGALGVAAAVADGDGDYGGEFVLGDEGVEGGEEEGVGAVGADVEGGGRGGDVLFGDVDGRVCGCRERGGWW